jgi:hypothetical protein
MHRSGSLSLDECFFTAKGCEVWRKGNAENAEVAERGGEGEKIENIEH